MSDPAPSSTCSTARTPRATLSSKAKIDPEWRADFDAAAARPLELRLRYAFVKTYKPILDDAPYRSFDTMEEYRQWCRDELPDWLGYGV